MNTLPNDVLTNTIKISEYVRPVDEVTLHSVDESLRTGTKSKKDPTPDLVDLGLYSPNVTDLVEVGGYLVFCRDSGDVWFAKDKQCLDSNFIYRSDLEIHCVENVDDAVEEYNRFCAQFPKGVPMRKKCYILDNPTNETYEVYYESDYPTLRYGKSTPSGRFVHSYKNRFHRDMAILKLDNLYSSQSSKSAQKLVSRVYGEDEAIIVSDGCLSNNSCCSSFYYMDDKSLSHTTEAYISGSGGQGALVAEVYGAYLALKMCKERGKRKVTYYYDNVGILGVLSNRKLDSIKEIAEYKNLCSSMHAEGFNITFVELHPKTGDNKDSENKALMYFHNMCDKDCTNLSDIFKKDYKSFAIKGNQNGNNLSSVYRHKGYQKQRGTYTRHSQDDVFGAIRY